MLNAAADAFVNVEEKVTNRALACGLRGVFKNAITNIAAKKCAFKVNVACGLSGQGAGYLYI